jgi:hypothetical protein
VAPCFADVLSYRSHPIEPGSTLIN